jgi:hypothetical protein
VRKSPRAPARVPRSVSPDNRNVDTFRARWFRWATALVALVVAVVCAAAWSLKLATWESHEGYFGPAFSADGRSIYTVTRQTTGITWGPGWEFFTPPAHAWLIADRIRLARIDVPTRHLEVLEEWPATPIAHRTIEEYRGRVFAVMNARVAVEPPDIVTYAVEVSVPRVPSSETYTLTGVWSSSPGARRRSAWRPGDGRGGTSGPVIVDDIELFTPSGPEMYPSAIVVLDHRTSTVNVMAATSAYRRQYPRGVSMAELLAVSRKPQFDREAAFKAKYDERVAAHRAAGLSEGDAMLRAYDDLEELGFLPRKPRLMAREVQTADESAPRFDIAEAEMASGIFNDLSQAIASPGREVRKSPYEYIVHRDYDNSRRLNAYLDGGGQAFFVGFRRRVYRLEIH